MERFVEIVFALLGLALMHFGFQALTRRAGRGVGNALRAGLRRLTTKRYRRKVAGQVQCQQSKDEAPPLENPHLD